MAATVEQCESKSIGPLSSTLEIFDTFKNQVEDKDSDEESFHLPLLECDDDIENAKEVLSGTITPCGESEDDILNKFETVTSPDLDSKLEEKILNENETKTTDNKSDFQNNDETVNNLKETQSEQINFLNQNGIFQGLEIVDEIFEENENELQEDNEPSVKSLTKISEDEISSDKPEKCKIDESESIGKIREELQNNDTLNTDNEAKKSIDIVEQEDKISNATTDKEKQNDEDNLKIHKEDTENIETENNEPDEITLVNTNETKVISSRSEELNKEPITTEILNENEDITEDTTAINTDSDENKSEEKLITEDKSNDSKDIDKEPEKVMSETDEKDLNCDDLLDISVIRDADEDNAIVEEITETDTHLSEKSDVEEQEDKRQSEIDDIEVEPMEFDDNTNSCDQDTSTTDNVIIDSEDKENNEELHINDTTEMDTNQSSAELVEVLKVSDKEIDKDNSVNPAEDLDEIKLAEDVQRKPNDESVEKLKENVAPIKKRPLSESDEESTVSKKMRIDVKVEKLEEKKNNIKTLINFEQFMKNRNLGESKLTRSDLEQFCLQKICEAIIHKTDVGELHQTIKKQENIIDTLRKDLQQLAKQTKDLDIVNRKLLNELKTQNGNQKPIVPLKITRSVGLQVKLNVGPEIGNRRKSFTANTPKTAITSNNTPNRSKNVPQGNIVRQVAQNSPAVNSQRKTPVTTPVLAHAVQNRTASTPAQSSATIPQVPSTANKRPTSIKSSSAPGVIDLTDEDDKSARKNNNSIQNKSVASPMKVLKGNILQKGAGAKVNNPQKNVGKGAGVKVGVQSRTINGLPPGVRLTATQMKNGITIPAGVVTTNAQGTTQLMYVVQPGSLVNSTAGGGQKAVLLNFQPTTNGVLTSTINGSTVSVIPSKTTNSMQIKPISVLRKHPAPLPFSPPVILNNSLKKLLPKPHLSIRKTETGIILQWRMPYNLDDYEGIASYQLFAYQETNATPSTDMWRKVGDVKALALPMACTLTQFADKNKYYFAVRSVDVHKRIGAFSDPEEISL